ncbi:MAG: excinuclease ABC subunit UvrA [Clostridia bacterium]|nr:excinuclease ABC subunit UvrA [Clostridia bacterium]
MANNQLIIRGARTHNLKNIDVTLPRDKLIVFTGLSGSGKSSLAFDTIYAEGQRRYVESLSSYARQFLGQMDKPDVDSIEGLSPAISIDQKTTSQNPRSTVGTVTEIYDYLRLLYARIGVPHCPVCGREISRQSVDQITARVLQLPAGTRIQILAPIVRGRKGEYAKEFEKARQAGFVRVRVDGEVHDLSEEIRLEKNKKHTIEIVVDRLVISPDIRSRLAESVETATAMSGGLTAVDVVGGEAMLFSQSFACPDHDVSMEELSPRMFSFNSPFGACRTCSGLGVCMAMDPDAILPDPALSIRQGAIRASGWRYGEDGTIAQMYYEGLAAHYGFSLDTPVGQLPERIRHILLYGTDGEKIKLVRQREYGRGEYLAPFEGVLRNMERRYRESGSEWARADLEAFMSSHDCPDCHGRRLRPEILAVTVGGKNIMELCELPVAESLRFLDQLSLSAQDRAIAGLILKELRARLQFLVNVGLEYLTLARAAGTLSGGEAQRIRLATQIGSSLTGVLYILDEPSIGLHQRDNDKLLHTLRYLRDLGNTLIVVEHDEDTMRAADFIVDIGPGAGVHGGQVICAGTPAQVEACRESVTGDFLSGRRSIPVPAARRPGNGQWLTVRGASENNLKNIDVSFCLGAFNCVTGVSGSGKSSLVNQILYRRLAAVLNGAKGRPGAFRAIEGIEALDKVIAIDQSPIGRTPRSNPATYTGVFNDIRALFASTPDAKRRGFSAARFSFNVKGGRCETCEGDGIIKIEMHFLPDIYVPCEVCKGRRYNHETLEVRYKGKNIYDVLEMTVEEGLAFFAGVPKIAHKLQTLCNVGLGYIKIGQPATTLSGGEAQRVKLATELSRRSTGRTMYILDEPTTGLHTADVEQLIRVLQMLVDGGNTVIVIEHNLHVIKTADYIVDLGPEGGDKGGTLVACGTPEEIAQVPASYTGRYLAPLLQK